MSTGSRSANVYDAGYTADFLAFKYGLSIGDAADLISRVGRSRDALDAAARMLKEQRRLGPLAA